MDVATANERITARLALLAMVPGQMIEFLARVARDAREEKGRKPIHIAVEVDVDPSTVYRFEQGHWPRHPDDIVNAYAADLDIEPYELWRRALDLWLSELPPQERAAVAAEEAARQRREQRKARGEGAPGNRKQGRGS